MIQTSQLNQCQYSLLHCPKVNKFIHESKPKNVKPDFKEENLDLPQMS